MHISDSLHDMRELLQCGAPVRELRIEYNRPAPDDWGLSTDPVNSELVSDVMQYNKLREELQTASWALDRICKDVVNPQRGTNLQWRILDAILGRLQTPIHRILHQIVYTDNFFSHNNNISSVNRKFLQEKGRLQARHELITGLFRDVKITLQDLYVDIGLYDPENSIVSDQDWKTRTEKQIWDRFCERIDKL